MSCPIHTKHSDVYTAARLCWVGVALLTAACGGTAPSAPTTKSTVSVTLAFQDASSCIPIPPLDTMPAKQCTLRLLAQATGFAGDALTYEWSGCGLRGYKAEGLCVVKDVGPVTATVEVTDANGHRAAASLTGRGISRPSDYVNHPPVVGFGYWTVSKPPGTSIEGLGSIGDPDEGELSGPGCPYVQTVKVSGDCDSDRYALLSCTQLEGLTLDIYRNQATGTCSVTVTVRDSWGLANSSTFPVPYDATSGSVTSATFAVAASTSTQPLNSRHP
jgi:hypothetical protein